MRPKSINFDDNPCFVEMVLLLRFVIVLTEHLNTVLLQEIEKVNKTLDVEQTIRFV